VHPLLVCNVEIYVTVYNAVYVQGRLGCITSVMAPQPPSANNETLQSDMGIPGERDRCYRPPPPKRTDDDDDDDDNDDDNDETTADD